VTSIHIHSFFVAAGGLSENFYRMRSSDKVTSMSFEVVNISSFTLMSICTNVRIEFYDALPW
jgi:hypothetical protein